MFDVRIECSTDYSDDSSNRMIEECDKKIPVKDEIYAAEDAKPCEDNKHNSG